MRNALGIALLAASLAGAPLLAACADAATTPDTRRDDASPADADGGASAPDGGAEDGAPRADSPEGALDANACFDGVDNDREEGADCSDARCSARAICCVGVASDACCGAPVRAVSWAVDPDCAPGPIDGCASAMALGTSFGLPRPAIEDGAIVANGAPTADSGLVLTRRVAPRTRIVQLTATLAAPTGCDDCVDGMAVGLIEERPTDDSRITPVVAIHVSGSRGEVSLVAGNGVLWRAALPDDQPHRYTLSVTPGGRVTLDADHTPATVDGEGVLVLPAGELAVAIYGRRTNRGAGDPLGARLTALEVAEAACDMPTALERGAPALDTPIGAPFAGRAHAPSVGVREGDGSRLVFAASGAIWMARPDGAGGWEVPSPATPVLVHNAPMPLWLDQPSLVAIEGQWALFVTVRDPSTGRAKIQVALGGLDFGEDFEVSGLRDVMTAMPDGVVEMDGPSAFVDGSEVVLVARARTASGETQIVLLHAPLGTDSAMAGAFAADGDVCGTGCASVEEIDESSTPPLHTPRHGDDAAFDRDEVAAPALVRTPDGIYRLYFAGRLGTRWSIGMLVSMDLRFFRDPVGRAVLSGSGEGRDALSVTDPEPRIESGRLVLLHTGHDGAQTHVLAAEQAIE